MCFGLLGLFLALKRILEQRAVSFEPSGSNTDMDRNMNMDIDPDLPGLSSLSLLPQGSDFLLWLPATGDQVFNMTPRRSSALPLFPPSPWDWTVAVAPLPRQINDHYGTRYCLNIL
jgi:hypothetical protein